MEPRYSPTVDIPAHSGYPVGPGWVLRTALSKETERLLVGVLVLVSVTVLLLGTERVLLGVSQTALSKETQRLLVGLLMKN